MITPKQHRVWRIAWDGEPSMSGRPHVMSIGTEFLTKVHAQAALANAPGFNNGSKPNIRIETRLVTEWENDS